MENIQKEIRKTRNLLIFLVMTAFLLGFFTAVLFTLLPKVGVETPLSFTSGHIAVAPSDSIPRENIKVHPDKVVIYINDASLSNYAPTGSMRPVLDSGANGIRVAPKSEKDIRVGDIITFKKDDSYIVHRVTEKGIDSEGIYFITRGDNNPIDDGKVRFEDVRYITVGIIY